MITVDCENVNQIIPWLGRAAIDHTQPIEADEKLKIPKRWAFTGPVCIHVRNPTQLVEFFPAAFGDPFKKFKALTRNTHWEFESWANNGVSEGLCVLNVNEAITALSYEGYFAEACFKWLMLNRMATPDLPVGGLRIVVTQPFVWGDLEEVANWFESELAVIYAQLEVHSMFNVPWKTWDQDLSILRENPMAVGYRDSWFRKVAKPMTAAGMAIEDGNLDVAQEILEQMSKLNDWRQAGEHFVKREREKADDKSNTR